MKVAIIGAGAIGKAIAKILESKKIKIAFYDKNVSALECPLSIDSVVRGAHFLFLCVPTSAVRDAVSCFSKFLGKKTIVISVSKGLENLEASNSKIALPKTVFEVLNESLPRSQPFALLFGPMLSKEFQDGMVGAAAVAPFLACAPYSNSGAQNFAVYKKIEKLFLGTNLQVEYSEDPIGLSFCGILKNIYAIACGIAQGMGWGNNARGIFIVNALREAQKILKVFGGDPKTVFGYGGLGDLIATGFSEHSRNYKTGVLIAKHLKEKNFYEIKKSDAQNLASEGLVSLEPMIKLLSKKAKKFKIIFSLYMIVSGKNKNVELLKILGHEIK